MNGRDKDTRRRALEYVAANPRCTAVEIATALDAPVAYTQRVLFEASEEGVVDILPAAKRYAMAKVDA